MLDLDACVKACGLLGAVLGVFNFCKACLRDRREAQVRANQHLVKASLRTEIAGKRGAATRLYLVNSDRCPVCEVTAEFFFEDQRQPMLCSIPSLAADEEHRVHECSKPFPERAAITYKDASGNKHAYDQKLYLVRWV